MFDRLSQLAKNRRLKVACKACIIGRCSGGGVIYLPSNRAFASRIESGETPAEHDRTDTPRLHYMYTITSHPETHVLFDRDWRSAAHG